MQLITLFLNCDSNTPRLLYRVNVKQLGISNNDSQFRKRKDVICYCKITSVMSLDVVTSFSRLKDVTNTCNIVQVLAGFPHCNYGKLEEAEDFKCVSSFIVC